MHYINKNAEISSGAFSKGFNKKAQGQLLSQT